VIDTPPLGSVIDAAVVSTKCDGTVIVIENNSVSYRFVQHVKEQLDVAGARILGVVLNKVDLSGKGYYGHYGNYYGRYYGKYYGKYYGSYGEESQPYGKRKSSGGAGSRKITPAAQDTGSTGDPMDKLNSMEVLNMEDNG
jgi:Mrp family chromosome partitioning ATPase